MGKHPTLGKRTIINGRVSGIQKEYLVGDAERVRNHYRALTLNGFEVRQGNDAVSEDEFVQAYLDGQTVDLWRDGRQVSDRSHIGYSGGGWS